MDDAEVQDIGMAAQGNPKAATTAAAGVANRYIIVGYLEPSAGASNDVLDEFDDTRLGLSRGMKRESRPKCPRLQIARLQSHNTVNLCRVLALSTASTLKAPNSGDSQSSRRRFGLTEALGLTTFGTFLLWASLFGG